MKSLCLRSPVVSPINCTLGAPSVVELHASALEISSFDVYAAIIRNPMQNAMLERLPAGRDRVDMVRRVRDRVNAHVAR